MTGTGRTVVFVGPSATPAALARSLPGASFEPPIARGDLYRVREAGAGRILIVDGVFSQSLAISPREVVDVIRDGAIVAGASSMGALRAAECWPAGMHGYGAIYRLYRRGLVESDDEVAVLTNPAAAFAAITFSLINIRYAVRMLVRRQEVTPAAATAILSTAIRMHYTKREPQALATKAGLSDASLQKVLSYNLKTRDALLAADQFSRLDGAAATARRIGTFRYPARYFGPDPLFGYSEADLKPKLLRWMFGSGRYQSFIWSLAAGAPEFAAIGASNAADRAVERRDALVEVMTRMFHQLDRLADELWAEMEFMDELEAEIARWAATQAPNATDDPIAPADLKWARDSVAIRHGVPDWEVLKAEVTEGRLFGVIPLPWIEEACCAMARGRSTTQT